MHADIVGLVACWSTIGVHGDSSCVELKKFVHCRNCPVYSAAAKHLLDVELPADYLSRWTQHVAHESAATESDSLSVIIFRLAAEWFALPTTVFAEIVGDRTIHSLPHRRGGVVLGLANVRGELLACVSMRALFELGESHAAAEHDRRTTCEARMLVLQRDGIRIVCPVDEVHGTKRYRPFELLATPATVSKSAATYTKAVLPWHGRSVGMLDDQLLFQSVNRSLTSIAT